MAITLRSTKGSELEYEEVDANFTTLQAADAALAATDAAAAAALADSSGSALVGFVQSGTGAVSRTAQDKMRESVSVKDFGAVGDGVTDDSAAFNAAWAHINASFDSDTANLFHVTRGITVPHGVYLLNSSVNWTGIRAWNIHVDMRGAKIIAGAGCAGKALIDATDVRGLHIDGGYIESTLAAASAPSCGLLLGPSGTDTCGNNSFRDLNIMGVFTVAPYINIGSETTYHYNCYFAQTNTDTLTYSFIADGAHSRAAVTSIYTTLRANNTLVSFTNNKFYGCHFRHYGNGSSMYLRYTSDWAFDAGCYILAFDKSNVELYQSSSQRNIALSLEGLYETSQGLGVDYVVTFIVPDGSDTGIVGFKFGTNTPHAAAAVFNVVNEAGGVSTGIINLAQAEIKIGGRLGSTMLFNATNCGNLKLSGELRYRSSAGLNLYDIAQFIGTVYTTDGSLISGTPGAKIFNYMLVDETTFGGQVFAVSKGPSSYLGVQNGTFPTIRAEGAATDIDLKLQGKGAGYIRLGTLTANADAPITGYISIKDAGGTVRKLAVID